MKLLARALAPPMLGLCKGGRKKGGRKREEEGGKWEKEVGSKRKEKEGREYCMRWQCT